ncbi:MAG: cobalamin-independent methionine synthase II family protein [Chloroflexi bacterium]|nr:cobalamin-independent methionine synthase II family protein [Chloroflexota bacterium]
MQRSNERILTTHVGSLAKPDDLQTMIAAREAGQPYDAAALAGRVTDAIAEVVRTQAEIGIDVVNDGEFSKSSWGAYFRTRLSNVDARPGQRSTPGLIYEREEPRFPDWFTGARAGGGPMFSYVLRAGAAARGLPVAGIQGAFCTGPLAYVGHAQVQADIDNLKAAARTGVKVEELCMTALAPPTMTFFLKNEHYATDRDFLFAIAEAMNAEYRAIADSGILLQLDEPAILTDWHWMTDATVAEYRAKLAVQVEALNVALRGVPPDRVRMHSCWGSIHHPHTDDIPLADVVDLILQVNVGAYSIEASNPRHDHEWEVWQDVKLPDGKILIPGVIGHFTDFVEHPRLVAERIVKYARVVGRENVIAGVDCGLGTRVGSESIQWAKLAALAEGARIASATLWAV